MRQPKLLKNFAIYVDGVDKIGLADTFKLPDLEVQTEDQRGGGLDTPIKNDMGLNSIDCEFTMAEHDPDVIRLFGRKTPFRLMFRGHMEDHQGASSTMVVTCEGRIFRKSPDTAEAGKKSAISFSMNCTYYREQQTGQPLIEIDVPNRKRIIGGEDQLASMRASLGG